MYLNLGNICKEIATFSMAHVSECFPKGLAICSTSCSQFSSGHDGRSQMESSVVPYYKAESTHSYEPHVLHSISQFAQCSGSQSELVFLVNCSTILQFNFYSLSCVRVTVIAGCAWRAFVTMCKLLHFSVWQLDCCSVVGDSSLTIGNLNQS